MNREVDRLLISTSHLDFSSRLLISTSHRQLSHPGNEMQARAEQSKNEILGEVAIEVARVRDRIFSALEWTTVVTLVIVMVLLILIATLCQSWIVFISVFIYVIIMSLIYIQFSRAYARKRLDNAAHTLTNFISSENVLKILDGAGAAYIAA